MAELIDLLIVDGGPVIDDTGIPVLISGREVVAQDLTHRILDAGHIFDLLGERNTTAIEQIKNRIELTAEKDERIIAGTVEVTFVKNSKQSDVYIQASTLQGDVAIALPLVTELSA